MAEKPKSTGVKLAQSAPLLPIGGEVPKVSGVRSPVSSPTVPSVYNKKLSKLFRGRLLALPGEFTLEEALRRMSRYNISSVPVTQSKDDSTILGFAGVLDALAYLCQLIGAKEGQEIETEKLADIIATFKDAPISSIVDTSGRNPFKLMSGEESLADAVEQYLKGVHRIAITDDEGNLTGVISQWTIANYLATVPTDDKEWIPIMNTCVGDATHSSNVVRADVNERTLDAFCRMYSNGLSALAIVDEAGKLWGNLSASDLRPYMLFLDDYNLLTRPVSEFLTKIRKKQRRPANFVVSFTRDAKVKDVINMLNKDIVHRGYIVDEEGKLSGAYSLTDLMQDLVADTHTISSFAKPTAQAPQQQAPK